MLDCTLSSKDDNKLVRDVNKKLRQPSKVKDAMYLPSSGLRQFDADTWAPQNGYAQAPSPFSSRCGPSSRLPSIDSEQSSLNDQAALASSYRQAPCLAESYSGTSTMSDASFIHMDDLCAPYSLARCSSRDSYPHDAATGQTVTCAVPSSLYQSMSQDCQVNWQQQAHSHGGSFVCQAEVASFSSQMQAQVQGCHAQTMQEMDHDGNWTLSPEGTQHEYVNNGRQPLLPQQLPFESSFSLQELMSQALNACSYSSEMKPAQQEQQQKQQQQQQWHEDTGWQLQQHRQQRQQQQQQQATSELTPQILPPKQTRLAQMNASACMHQIMQQQQKQQQQHARRHSSTNDASKYQPIAASANTGGQSQNPPIWQRDAQLETVDQGIDLHKLQLLSNQMQQRQIQQQSLSQQHLYSQQQIQKQRIQHLQAQKDQQKLHVEQAYFTDATLAAHRLACLDQQDQGKNLQDEVRGEAIELPNRTLSANSMDCRFLDGHERGSSAREPAARAKSFRGKSIDVLPDVDRKQANHLPRHVKTAVKLEAASKVDQWEKAHVPQVTAPISGPALLPQPAKDLCSPEALCTANQMMSSVVLPGGCTYVPVLVTSRQFYWGVRWGFTAFVIALGSSYFQRLAQTLPALRLVMDTTAVEVEDMAESGNLQPSNLADSTVTSIQFACIYIACKVVDRMPHNNQLQNMLSLIFATKVSAEQANEVEARCLDGLHYRLGPFFAEDPDWAVHLHD